MYKENATKYVSSQSYGRSPCEYWKLERHSGDLVPQGIQGFGEAFLGCSLQGLQLARAFPGTEQQRMGMQPETL